MWWLRFLVLRERPHHFKFPQRWPQPPPWARLAGVTQAPDPPFPPLRPPSWARAGASDSPLAAVFAAGAALAALDAVVRRDAPHAGVWRRRLALKAALASLAGRREEEGALRDGFAFTPPGVDPGPAGRVYLAWRALGASRLADFAVPAGLYEAHAASSAPAPLAAAAAAASGAGAALADCVLAARLGWRAPLPLLAAEIGRIKPGAPGWDAACCAAYARAATAACDLDAQLARAAARLRAVAPKLRAKGAQAVIAALLEEDALTAAARLPGVSERGLRRLFDRLVALDALRELSGRPTFRLYGL